MARATKLDMQKKELLEALEDSLGIVTVACKQVDIARQTFYNWYKNDESFKQSVDDLHDVALDFAENALHNRIKEKSDTAIIFFLKTQGKKRGYIERTEHEYKEVDEFSNMTDEEIEQQLNELDKGSKNKKAKTTQRAEKAKSQD